MKDGVTEHRTRRRVAPPSQIRSLFPILKNPANRHRAVGFTKEQFHDAFANTVSREESDVAYDLLHIPAPGNWVWARGLAQACAVGMTDPRAECVVEALGARRRCRRSSRWRSAAVTAATRPSACHGPPSR